MYEPTCLLAINHLLGESHVLGSNNDRRHSEIIDSSMLEVNPDKFEHTRYILTTIKARFKIGNASGDRARHHVVAGDQKLFAHMCSIKETHPKEFEWLIPIPGDWHMMMNLQQPIIDEYWGLGLMNVANGNKKDNSVGGLGWSALLAHSRLKQGNNKSFRDRHIYLR